jgi:hypothetical protein
VFPGFTLSSAPQSYHRGHKTGAAGVDEGVSDMALARDQIRSVMIGAELGRGSRSGLYHCQGGPSAVS